MLSRNTGRILAAAFVVLVLAAAVFLYYAGVFAGGGNREYWHIQRANDESPDDFWVKVTWQELKEQPRLHRLFQEANSTSVSVPQRDREDLQEFLEARKGHNQDWRPVEVDGTRYLISQWITN